MSGLPPVMDVGGGGGEAQNRPKLEPWRVFSHRTYISNISNPRWSRYGRETCQKCNPFARNATRNSTPSSEIASVRAVLSGVENRTPSPEMASKMRPLKQKCKVKSAKMRPLDQKWRQKYDPFARKGLWPRRTSARGAILGTPWGPVLQPLSLCYN